MLESILAQGDEYKEVTYFYISIDRSPIIREVLLRHARSRQTTIRDVKSFVEEYKIRMTFQILKQSAGNVRMRDPILLGKDIVVREDEWLEVNS